MRHGSLFSGIGGFDLAAEWMGWDNIFHCEINEFCQKVLSYHFPKSIQYHDITNTDFNVHRGQIDILTGGFPCQPYSVAGKRKGKEDDRHLWPYMLKAIKAIQARWIVGENVFGITNWNGGLVFNEVQAEMEAAGYEVWPYVLPACAVNAPHRRDRVWFVAHANNDGRQANTQQQPSQNSENEVNPSERRQYAQCDFIEGFDNGFTHNSTSTRVSKNKSATLCNRERDCPKSPQIGSKFPSRTGATDERTDWASWPTQSPVCNGNDGLSPELDGITFSKWRNESIKAGGNAIVPQVALQIFKVIEQYET